MLFYCYRPTAAWGRWQARAYGRVARWLGFDGIHWDTLGRSPCGATDADAFIAANGYADFLRAAGAELTAASPPLKQTLNWVSAWGWREAVHAALVAFPYAECWSSPCQQSFLGNGSVAGRGGAGGVVAYYPCKNAALLQAEWAWAASTGSSYLVVADGARHLTNEYFPNAQRAPLEPKAAAALEAFWKRGCAGVLPPTRCDCGAACPAPHPMGNCHDWGCLSTERSDTSYAGAGADSLRNATTAVHA